MSPDSAVPQRKAARQGEVAQQLARGWQPVRHAPGPKESGELAPLSFHTHLSGIHGIFYFIEA